MARPGDLCFTHLNYIAYLLTLLERLYFLGPSLCAQLRFKKIRQTCEGEQLPCGQKQLISLSSVNGIYIGVSWTRISQIKFRIDRSKISE